MGTTVRMWPTTPESKLRTRPDIIFTWPLHRSRLHQVLPWLLKYPISSFSFASTLMTGSSIASDGTSS